MKIIIIFLFFCLTCFAQQTVTDFDGNVYETVTIGDQVWLKENLKSLHYCDGEPVPEVVAYNNVDSLGSIYGLLYTWDAAMKDSDEPGVQGVCPCDWHVPTDEEWTILENYLGGPSVAGGKMKETGTEHWLSPNTGATNSSGFTGLPAGEFDAYFIPNKFWLLHTAAVFWTSSQTNQLQAIERYLSHDDAVCGSLPWHKVMKYSIRCIKDTVTTDINSEPGLINHFELFQNYPNPFNPNTTIRYELREGSIVKIKIYNLLGKEIVELVNEFQSAGFKTIKWDGRDKNGYFVDSGMYFYTLIGNNFSQTKKMLVIK
jgi:uncharacterized protein (TIGR02145 family)